MPLDNAKAKELLDKARERNPGITRDQAKQLLNKANQSFESQTKETNVPQDKIEELKQYRDFQPTEDMTKGQQFAGGFQKGNYKNIEAEPTLFSKFAKKASDVAPTIGSTVAGTIGRVLGRKPGAVASGAGYGVGLAFGESLENIAGIQNETPGELAKEAVAEPLAVGATDYAMDYGLDKLGKATAPIREKVSGAAKGLIKEFSPSSKGVFKSIFTVPRKIASRLNLDGMSEKMVDYNISGNLDDFEKVSSKVTGSNGTLTKVVRDALGNVGGDINTSQALDMAQQSADDALNLDDKVINKTLRKVTNIVSKRQGNLPGKNKAIDMWDAVQALEKEGYNLMGKSTDMTPRIDMEQQARIFLSTADALKDQIDNLIVDEGVVDSIKNKYVADLVKVSPKLAEEFLQITNIRDIRALAKPFVDLSTATKLTKDASLSVFDKVLTGQQGGYRGVELLKPGTWVAPIIERPGVKSFLANQGKNISKGVNSTNSLVKPFIKPASEALNVARRGLTSTGINEYTK